MKSRPTMLARPAPTDQRPSANQMRARAVATFAIGLALMAGCSSGPPESPSEPPAALVGAVAIGTAQPPRPGELRIRLAFGANSDLDLQVTGPRLETVYFANSPGKNGARLVADVRCGSPAPRIETILFPSARPGWYRVSVDHPTRCEDAPEAEPKSGEPFVIEVDGAGISERAHGNAPKGTFVPIAFEFEIPARPAGSEPDERDDREGEGR